MARRPGLGKGLDSLIPRNEDQEEYPSKLTSSQVIIQVPFDLIHPNPQQPRISLDMGALEELADSIREHGVLQPLIVSENLDVDQYTLIAGERRWRAAEMAGLSMVPVIIRSVTEQEQLELALIENLQRSDLNPLEKAQAYSQLADNFSMTHEQIAERIGKSRTSITNTIRLLNLPDQAQRALGEGIISEGHARAILGLPNHQAQRAALSTILNLGLNVRQTEALVKKMSGKKPSPVIRTEPQPEISALEEQLRKFFETKVKLNRGRKGGNLVIYYYSDEELNAILDKIFPKSTYADFL
ncbi:MAG: ParB/RepB/Spo0J family partition protein [Chloroflexota bacterium]|nr:ParB/RepB/Spo0J family partition protein [Chloroflexota bacterium]